MANQNQDRLRTHFSTLSTDSHAQGWDSLWETASFLPWDRGYANPALIDLLKNPSSPPLANQERTPNSAAPGSPSHVDLPAPLKADGSRRKVLIPGCGRGFDVVLFAAHGYDAVGLEVSSHAVEAASKYVGNHGPGPLEGEYAVKDEKVGRGAMEIVVGDYFEDAWLQGLKVEGGFDIIYDNTFLCALPPALRPKWAKRTTQLLSKAGVLICLEFPTYKPASSGGPPWALPPTVHEEALKRPGEDLQYDEQGVIVSTDREESDNALVRVAHYVPKRTHEVATLNGLVRDNVSIWRHKSS